MNTKNVCLIALMTSSAIFSSIPRKGIELSPLCYVSSTESFENISTTTPTPSKRVPLLRGVWEKPTEKLEFKKDSLKAVSRNKTESVAFRIDRKGYPGKIYLLFDTPEGQIEMPYAIYDISGDSLKIRNTNFKGVSYRDYPYIDFPENFDHSTKIYIKGK